MSGIATTTTHFLPKVYGLKSQYVQYVLPEALCSPNSHRRQLYFVGNRALIVATWHSNDNIAFPPNPCFMLMHIVYYCLHDSNSSSQEIVPSSYQCRLRGIATTTTHFRPKVYVLNTYSMYCPKHFVLLTHTGTKVQSTVSHMA